jgi:hypothetical protein
MGDAKNGPSEKNKKYDFVASTTLLYSLFLVGFVGLKLFLQRHRDRLNYKIWEQGGVERKMNVGLKS